MMPTQMLHMLAHLQAVCIAACYPEDWPLLVICPSAPLTTKRQ
jgi:hypothetical protein